MNKTLMNDIFNNPYFEKQQSNCNDMIDILEQYFDDIDYNDIAMDGSIETALSIYECRDYNSFKSSLYDFAKSRNIEIKVYCYGDDFNYREEINIVDTGNEWECIIYTSAEF